MSEPAYDVIVCGSLHLDIVVNAPHLPRLDETVAGTAWSRQCGGKGGNQAVQAARHGARTAFMGRVGADEFGERLMAHLEAARVDRTAVVVDPAAVSGMSVAIVEATGEYGAAIVSGANLAIPPDSVPETWERLGGGRVLVLQNEVPHAVNVAAARAARADGRRVVLNAAPARACGEDLLAIVDVLVVNRVEAEMMAGCPVFDAASASAAFPALGAPFKTVVVTLGSAGLVVSSPGRDPVAIAAAPVQVVSAHGAGDCFVGALVARLAAGAGVVEACQFANDAAGLFVSTPPASAPASSQPPDP